MFRCYKNEILYGYGYKKIVIIIIYMGHVWIYKMKDFINKYFLFKIYLYHGLSINFDPCNSGIIIITVIIMFTLYGFAAVCPHLKHYIYQTDDFDL